MVIITFKILCKVIAPYLFKFSFGFWVTNSFLTKNYKSKRSQAIFSEIPILKAKNEELKRQTKGLEENLSKAPNLGVLCLQSKQNTKLGLQNP